MKRNYHTHTPLCGHATGTVDEYVRKAIEGGLTVLGFSDHTPYTYPDGISSPSKMSLAETPLYFETVSEARERYRDHIEIHIGFETEYYPAYWDKLIDFYRDYPVEYLLYGGHFIGNEGEADCFRAFDVTEDPDRLDRYVEHTLRAMQTGRFSALAHPDVINIIGDEDLYRQQMRRIILEAKRLSLPLEVNMHGMRDGRHYPNPIFWEEVSRLGATAYFGMDCHAVAHVADRVEIEQAHRFADRYSLNVVDELRLISPNL